MDKNKCPKNEKPGPTFEKNLKIRFWILNYVFLSSKKIRNPSITSYYSSCCLLSCRILATVLLEHLQSCDDICCYKKYVFKETL